jgi:hypothetical protein
MIKSDFFPEPQHAAYFALIHRIRTQEHRRQRTFCKTNKSISIAKYNTGNDARDKSGIYAAAAAAAWKQQKISALTKHRLLMTWAMLCWWKRQRSNDAAHTHTRVI